MIFRPSAGRWNVRRWLFAIVAATSLLLFVPSAVMWGRSYWRCDSFGYSHHAPPGPRALDWGWHVESTRGFVALTYFRDLYTDAAVIRLQNREAYRSRWFWNVIRQPRPRGPWFLAGGNVYPYGTHSGWAITLPYPLICAAAAVAPLAAFRRFRQRRRRAHLGLCLNCGYDLRATTTGRCPECGADATRFPPAAPELTAQRART